MYRRRIYQGRKIDTRIKGGENGLQWLTKQVNIESLQQDVYNSDFLLQVRGELLN